MDKVHAQVLNMPGSSVTGKVENVQTIGELIGRILPFIFAFAGFGLLLMIISSGYTLLTSAGEPKKAEMGKQKFTNAVTGFIIIFAAFWLVQIAGYIFGIEEITTVFGNTGGGGHEGR